jgi:hypothetical protein
VWGALQQSLREGAKGADLAKDSYEGLLRRINQSVSVGWHDMLKSLGDSFKNAITPALTKLTTVFEKAMPVVMRFMSGAASHIASIASWASGVFDGMLEGMLNVLALMQSGDLATYVKLSITHALLSAANAFVNFMVMGFEATKDTVLFIADVLSNGEVWAGIGEYLLNTFGQLGNKFYSMLMGAGQVLFDAFAPVLGYTVGVFDFIASKFTGAIMRVLAYGAEDGPAKDEMWNKSERALNLTLDQAIKDAKKDVPGVISFAGDKAKEFDEDAAMNARDAQAGLDRANIAVANTKGPKDFSQYDRPDLLKPELDALSNTMADTLKRSRAEFDKTNKPKDKDVPLIDSIGQGGPASVADSLQSVGGGGFAAGVSWEQQMLAENKEQNVNLRTLVGKTPSVSGAFGGGVGAGTKETPVTILSSIHTTVADILSVLKAGGGGKQGSLVSIR